MATEYFSILHAEHNGIGVQDQLTSATCFDNKLPKESSAQLNIYAHNLPF